MGVKNTTHQYGLVCRRFFVVCFRLRMSWLVGCTFAFFLAIFFVWFFLWFSKALFLVCLQLFAVCFLLLRCVIGALDMYDKRDSALKNTHDKRDNALYTCSIRPPAHTPHELQCTHNVHDTRQRNNTQRTTCMEHETHNKQRSRYIQMDRTRPIVVWILAHANVAHEAAQCSDTVWRTEQFRLLP